MRRQLFILFASLVLIGIVLGIIANIQGSSVHQYLEQVIIKSCEKTLECRLSTRLESVGFLHNQVVLKNLHATPINNDNSWGWTCKKLTLSFSLWQLISKRLFAFALDCHEFNVQTTYDNGSFGITPHLNALAREPDFPLEIALTGCSVKPISITITDTRGNSVKAKARIAVAQSAKQVKIRSHILECAIATPERTLVWNTAGSIEAVCNKKTIEKNIISRIQMSCEPIKGVIEQFSFNLDCKDDCASLSIHNHDTSLALDECTVRLQPHHIMCKAHARMGNIQRLLGQLGNKKCSASANIGAEIDYKNAITAKLHADVENITLLDIIMPYKATLDASYEQQKANGILTIARDGTDICNILASADMAHNDYQASAELLEAQNIYGYMLNSCCLQASLHQCLFSSHLESDITNQNGGHVPLNITLSPNKDTHEIVGSVGSATLSGEVTLNEKTMEGELRLHSAQQNLLGSCAVSVGEKKSSCHANINSSGIQLCLDQLNHPIQADGTIDIQTKLQDDILFFQTSFNGMARLGSLHNWLKKISLEGYYNFENKTCYLHTLDGELYRGSFHMADARCVLDQQYGLEYLHAPITLSECLINIRKDLFTMISSGLVISYKKQEQPYISGTIFFDKTMIKENLFSPQFIQSLFPQSVATNKTFFVDPLFSIAIQTKDVIHVKTPLLELAAHMRLSLQGSASHPELQGRILLQSGSLAFPYARLLFSKGKIEFAKDRITDPIIELHARNTIKKYKISLQVTGSLKYPHILLDSYPNLSQEQILCLLLAGSPDSLSGIAPAALLQSMKYLVLDAEHAPSKLHAAIRQLFAPFKHIYLIPSFSDQTSRGGLRGAIEIDIADRWRALIQKNFSLTEDTRLEIEYAITDDMWFRAFRDERHDVGAELEFRWKF